MSKYTLKLTFSTICIIAALTASTVLGIGEGLGPMAPVMDNPLAPGSSSGNNTIGGDRVRDGARSFDEQLTAANDDIKAKIGKLAEMLNSGKDLSSDDTAVIADSVKTYNKYVNKMKPAEQANYHILSAWAKYFANQPKPARAAAMAAFKADPKNRNARSTLVAMALVNDDVRSLKSATGMVKSTKPRSARAGSSFNNEAEAAPQEPAPSDTALIDFDAESMMTEIMGQKLGALEAKCINGSSFNFSGGKTLFAIVWSLANTGNAAQSADGSQPADAMPGMAPMAAPGSSDSGAKLAPMQNFAKMFESNFDSENIVFLGINTDPASESKQVVSALCKNGWPWAQVMASAPANESLTAVTKTKIAQPALVIVSGDGTVIYAGSAAGIIPQMVAKHAAGTASKGTITGSGTTTVKTAQSAEPEKSTEPEKTADTAKPAENTAAAGENKPDVKNTQDQGASQAASGEQQPSEDQPKVKAHKSDEEQLNPQASNLYNFALSQKRTARYTGYGKMVEACRQVLREYPDTPEAEKCRQLLREIPANKRAQFHITNEEMGL